MAVFFTADTHFGSERTLQLSCRPFDNVIEMDEMIIANWNYIIDDDDIIYHLGDFGDTNKLNELSGKMILLPGNYDNEDAISKISETCKIIKPNIILDIEGTNEDWQFQLVHEPDEAINSNEFFLFGHIHKLQMVKRNGLNVGVDCHSFYPIGLETVLFYKNGIENHYDENVFQPSLGGA